MGLKNEEKFQILFNDRKTNLTNDIVVFDTIDGIRKASPLPKLAAECIDVNITSPKFSRVNISEQNDCTG